MEGANVTAFRKKMVLVAPENLCERQIEQITIPFERLIIFGKPFNDITFPSPCAF